MRSTRLIDSFSHAVEGLMQTGLHQRNFRIQVLAGIMVGLVGCGIPFGLAEKVTMMFCVLLILFAELLNSSLEHVVDLATEEVHQEARLAKDAAAAGVLVLSIGTVVIFAAILADNARTIADHPMQITRQVMLGVPLTLCAGALMHERRKPLWLDATVVIAAVGLLAGLLLTTESYAFWTMSVGLVGLAAATGWRRRTGCET
jgi:diacylglycerol kinase (ATP)